MSTVGITASASSYTPPVQAPSVVVAEPVAPVTHTPAENSATNSNDNVSLAPVATNANTSAPATYTAVASASASNIRGTNVNTTA